MKKLLDQMILYRRALKGSAIEKLGNYMENPGDLSVLSDVVYEILSYATEYGLEEDLYFGYLAGHLIMDENPFSLQWERRAWEADVIASADSVSIVKEDMKRFYELAHISFSDALGEGGEILSRLRHYRSIPKKESNIQKNVGQRIREITDWLSNARNEDEFFQAVLSFYEKYGVGNLGLNRAFHLSEEGEMIPIVHTANVGLDHIVGYESQKKELRENTEAFVKGAQANNCLLYGDAGTGKSTCIKGILNDYYKDGLRLVEVYKHQFKNLPNLLKQVKNRNYRFVIYMDDLSFEDFEIEYKYLKAVIEGGMEVKPDNVVIYATSNRRNLIKENWNDRTDATSGEVHPTDTMQEKQSLAARFGIVIPFMRPSKKEYAQIVLSLAREYGLQQEESELLKKADLWSVRNGGYSGRTAEHFIIDQLQREDG